MMALFKCKVCGRFADDGQPQNDLCLSCIDAGFLRADVVEYDDEGNIIGWGSDADYDTHAVEVQNGDGYYDEDGHFHRYNNYDDWGDLFE